jgi:hypothetical protein
MQGDIAAGDMSYNSETMNGNTNNTETKINTDNNTDREQCSNQNQESSQQQQPTPIKPYPNFLPWKMGACSPETSLTTSISILNISVAPTAATVGSLTPSPSPEDNVRAKAAVEVNATNDNSYNKKEPAFEIGMSVRESPSPIIAPTAAPSFIPNLPLLEPNHLQLQEQQLTKELYDDRLFNLGLTQPDGPLGMVLEAACTSMGYDIAEMWLRTGPKTHQLIQSHLRYAALDETTREAVVEVYYGERASSFHHKLSPAMCKKARATNNVVWVTSQTSHGSQALLCSLSGVKAAVAVPVCHEQSQTDMTLIYFSMREMRVQPVATEFLTHMSLSAAILSVNVFDPSLLKQRRRASRRGSHMTDMGADDVIHEDDEYEINDNNSLMQKSIQRKVQSINVRTQLSENYNAASTVGDDSAYYNDDDTSSYYPKSVATAPHLSGRRRMSEPPRNLQHHPPQYPVSNIITNTANLQQYPPPISNIVTTTPEYSANGANLNIDWNDLRNVEYLTDGGNNWIHTSVFNNGPSVIKQLKPEVADVVSAMDEIEGELKIHSQLDHRNIVTFQGAGYDRKGKRFLVMERLDGGTLSQLMGYDTRIRDRRRRFFTKKKKLPYRTVLSYAQQIAAAMDYLHRNAVEGGMVVHRDLKPDNIGKSTWN